MLLARLRSGGGSGLESAGPSTPPAGGGGGGGDGLSMAWRAQTDAKLSVLLQSEARLKRQLDLVTELTQQLS